jgi:hypothetical protein
MPQPAWITLAGAEDFAAFAATWISRAKRRNCAK